MGGVNLYNESYQRYLDLESDRETKNRQSEGEKNIQNSSSIYGQKK
jgi:hypothetical protein